MRLFMKNNMIFNTVYASQPIAEEYSICKWIQICSVILGSSIYKLHWIEYGEHFTVTTKQ